MLTLSEEQKQEIQKRTDSLVRVRDPGTNEEYVIVPAKIFDRLQALFSGAEQDVDQALVFANEVMAEDDAGDPLLESYQKYRQSP